MHCGNCIDLALTSTQYISRYHSLSDPGILNINVSLYHNQLSNLFRLTSYCHERSHAFDIEDKWLLSITEKAALCLLIWSWKQSALPFLYRLISTMLSRMLSSAEKSMKWHLFPTTSVEHNFTTGGGGI